MNPPSALHGAMSRDRKPFTYTPGGLDLSEIKSERMAKRLMRNAMNQGVPETTANSVHSQSNTSASVALPNFNCLPVQVFPSFNLPANPKSLLRTRSDPRETPIQRVVPSTVNNTRFDNNDTLNNNNKYTPAYSQVNNNRPVSMYEYNTIPAPAPVNTYSLPRVNYGSDGYTVPVLPEISYEAEYFRAPPKLYSAPEQLCKLEISEEKDKLPTNESVETILDLTIKPLIEVTIPTFVPTPVVTKEVTIPTIEPTPVGTKEVTIPTISSTPVVAEEVTSPTISSTPVVTEEVTIPTIVPTPVVTNDVIIPTIVPIPVVTKEVTIPTISSTPVVTEEVTSPTIYPTPVVTKPVEENAGTENEQSQVKVVKKQVKKESKVEEQNNNQNGDANVEAEMTVKLPAKKSAAKTETKVEVVKKVLPDGSVEEVKTTTTKTTIDGRTEIKTKTETTIIPKEDESEEEVVEEEEEGEVEEVQDEQPETTKVTTTTVAAPKENGQESKVVKTEERSESTSTTTKKVVVVQDSPKEKQSVEVEEQQEQEEEESEEEVVEEAEPVTVVLKKQATPEPPVVKSKPVEEEEEEEEEVEEEPEEEEKPAPKVANKEVEPEEEEIEEDEVVEVKKEVVKAPPPKDEEEEEEEEEEEYEEAEEKEETKVTVKKETEVKETKEEEEEEDVESVEEEVKEEKEVISQKPVEEPKETPEEKVIKVEVVPPEEPKEEKPEPAPQTQYNIPVREPSIPLDKVEDVEIKPIGSSPIISKTHTENTEIITSTVDPSSGLSRQTEYNKIENIVTVNRTTKILDHNYENLTQQGIPTVRTYFPPPSIDRISTSPLPSRPYQPVYPPEPTTERRHSLLLERLSTERQMPSDIYQYGNQNNQSYDQNQYPGEPRAEVLTVSNVKPSSITSDQQWYQKTNQNIIYNNISSTPTPTGQPWAQPKSQPQPQQQYQPQPQYQAPTQQYQPSPTPQPQYQPSSAPQYQQSYSEPAPERAPSSYSTYTPTPSWAPNTDSQQNTTQSNQYSYKDTSDSYSKSTQQYSSSYVPPPWEQDTSYTSVNNTSQVYYAPAPLPETKSFNSAPTAGWNPPPPKFTKTTPIAYIPPAPNQSFVRSASVSEPSRTPGRRTYYSEYERRYITVPESTYIPTETKYQPQPDPSPQYYYDNNEPSEEVEPQWRRELREFTEKTSQTTTTTTEQTNVQPPWQAEVNYLKNPIVAYTPTPTWSQTLRPRSFRERSFESEYVSQEWPKTTNTLGRGRPLSTIGKSVDAPIPEKTRGVSVDRYNPVSYHSPSEHAPVQAHTLTTPVPHGGYHNPNVPAYHTRASAEPREQPTSYQPRVYRESRASPLQSRSFKYLQWITGTEN